MGAASEISSSETGWLMELGGGQIGSDPGLRAALGGRGAGGWVPGNYHLREAPEGEVETGGGFHLNDDVC